MNHEVLQGRWTAPSEDVRKEREDMLQKPRIEQISIGLGVIILLQLITVIVRFW